MDEYFSAQAENPFVTDSVWGYNDDGTEWGLLYEAANGEFQSPIDINSREAKYDETLNHSPLTIGYNSFRECDMINDGHSVAAIFRHSKLGQIFELEDNFRSVISGGPLPADNQFELVECCFHWGREDSRGSEHTVNFKSYPMELHLMHWNSTNYKSIEEAIGKPDGVAIIALFVQIGNEHDGLRLFTESLSSVQYKGRTTTIKSTLRPSCLLPDPMLRDFWTYKGSLTCPPCSEEVTWIIFRYPLLISNSQLEDFRRLRSHVKGIGEGSDDGFLSDNFRPTQPINDRIVRANFQ